MKYLKSIFDLKTSLFHKAYLFKINKIQKCFQSSSLTASFKIYQIDSPLFEKVLTNELKTLSEIFKKHNFELRIAGGAVRDLVMNIMPNDIDLATNALPSQMLDMFEKEKIRVINMSGLKHGTVPVRINDVTNFEITTLRIDVKTYGRHAEVEFTNDWHKDAIRRDLTVNSLFLDFDGKIHDYVDGMEDIKKKIVRFVGIADKRVKEDYLRILRYFRFYSKVCDNPNTHDEESLKAIKNNAEGLKMISGERIAYEFRKILSQKFVDSFIKLFYELNLAPHIGLPKNGNLEKFTQIYNSSFKNQMKPMTLLSALMNTDEDIISIDERLKLSKDEKYIMFAVKKYENILRDNHDKEKIIEYLTKQFLYPKALIDRPLKKYEAVELMKFLNKTNLIQDIESIQKPQFTLAFKDLNEHVIFVKAKNKNVSLEEYSEEKKIRFNYLFTQLKIKWIDSCFKLTNQDLLKLIDENYLQTFIKTKSKKEK